MKNFKLVGGTKNVAPILWKSEINIFGHKIMMENHNSKKLFGAKVLEIFRNYKNFKPLFFGSTFNFFLKFLITGEVCLFLYNKLLKGRITTVDTFIKENNYLQFINKQKYSYSDFFTNIFLYSFMGKFLSLKNKNLFYITTAAGLICSIGSNYINNSIEMWMNSKYQIEEFYIFREYNLIPKIYLTTCLIKFFDFIFRDRIYTISRLEFTINRKGIVIFLWLFFLAKFTQLQSVLIKNNTIK